MIDSEGGNHLAVECDARIRYSVQVGAEWDTQEFAPPDKRQERDPQLATQGDLLYLAYTRVAVEDGGCGDDGLRDVGVYVRSRSLPDGRWSDAKRIGEVADHLQAFRVAGGTIHATVENADDGRIYYETLRGETYRRYEIPHATGVVALRIGDDGKARIAYEADAAIRYGAFTGSGFSTKEIAGSSRGYGPVLVLGAGDRPYLLWRRGYHGGGCMEPDPEPEDGMYYSSQVGGVWKSERLTRRTDIASLTVDVDAGRVHALVAGKSGLVYLTRSGSGSWSKRIFEDLYPGGAVIRLDPVTGALLVAYIRYVDEETRVYVMSYR